MQRSGMSFLTHWLKGIDRKPLVIRGARQVGKTWLVRHFAKSEGRRLIEINFEKQPQLITLFASNDPKKILLHLGVEFKLTINPSECLLFLDEIQAEPEILAKLRWFCEDMPELPVIAAGSLLEFVLATHTFSMPVGRINYMHLEPLTFEEFLVANDEEMLVSYLEQYTLTAEIPLAIHQKLMGYFKEYLIIGGMPAAVSNWINNRSFSDVNRVHLDLLATYRDDFAKYRGRLDQERLEEVMRAVPKLLGEKFVYSKVNSTVHTASVKQALNLLCKARLCHVVSGCSANGVPLGAETNEKYLKVVLLDTGLCSASLGLMLNQFTTLDEIILVNSGGLAEQVVGQCLRTISPPYIEPALYYWHREHAGSNAEIDYCIQHHHQVIPIEVKAGTTGSLKSLHYFMGLKQFDRAVRINSNLPSQAAVQVKDHQGNEIEYTLISIPFYLIKQLHRLLNA